jgi:hypothetical protein
MLERAMSSETTSSEYSGLNTALNFFGSSLLIATCHELKNHVGQMIVANTSFSALALAAATAGIAPGLVGEAIIAIPHICILMLMDESDYEWLSSDTYSGAFINFMLDMTMGVASAVIGAAIFGVAAAPFVACAIAGAISLQLLCFAIENLAHGFAEAGAMIENFDRLAYLTGID